MTSQSQNGDGRANEFIPEPPKHQEPSKKEFKPWHKPRKQWVRLKQWKRDIANLLDTLIPLNRPFNYLSLPGEDLLDVRVVAKACLEKGVDLKFLGFNDGFDESAEDQFISRSELKEKDHIDPDSEIIPDRFENIAKDKTVAERRLRRHGTFDAVNLDLCNSFAARNQNPETSYYNSAVKLAEHQIINGREKPWLFFITTQCGKDDVDHNDINKMHGLIKENINNSKYFRDSFYNSINEYDYSYMHDDKNILNLGSIAFLQAFCIGLGKWFLKTMHRTGWAVEILPSCYYTVYQGPDMLSLGLKFSQIEQKLVDSTGLARNYSDDGEEGKLAAKLVEPACSMEDLDSLLKSDDEVLHEMIDSSKEILKHARYDTNRYEIWLKENNYI